MQRPLFFFFLLLFGFSGFAGLIYESIWAQYLKLLLGHSAYAQLLVLVIFMGGMALGAWVVAHYSHKMRNLLKIYAVVELCLGLFGAYFHSIYVNSMGFLQETLLINTESALSASIVLWLAGALMILPQSILLGSTFPLMTTACLRRFPEKSGRSIALLYFVNSLGGAIGVLIPGFFLVEKLGLPGTVLTAGVINVLIALSAWIASIKTEEPDTLPIQQSNQTSSLLFSPKVMLLCSLITGFSSFIYEIIWIRMLSMVLGSSTHAFELMLSAFIFGLAFGSFFINQFITKLKNPLRTLAYIQIVMGCMALLTLPAYNFTFTYMASFLQSIPKTEWGYFILNSLNYSLCLIFMLPTTLCAGMTFPLITEILLQKNYGEKSIGQVYTFNTLGAIVGAILAQQWIMPNFGLKAGVGLGALVDIGLGLGMLWLCFKTFRQLSFVTASALSLISSVAVLGFVHLNPLKMASGVFRQGHLLTEDKNQVVFHKDGKTATIAVVKWANSLGISTNGKTDASIAFQGPPGNDESTQIMLPVISWSLFPEARKIAVIGLGSGMSTHTFLSIPSVEQVDTIEIEPAVVEGAKLFGERVKLTFEDKRSHLILEDARSYFTRSKSQYDLIMSEPSNPWVSGVSNLFTEEFYQLAKRSLTPKGVFAQWINLYDLSPTLIASVLKAVGQHFPFYTLYLTDNTDLLIIASKEDLNQIPSSKIFSIPALQTALERVYVKSNDDLLLHRLGDRKTLGAFFESFPINSNSDYFPVLDLNANKVRFLAQTANLIDLKYSPLPLSLLLDLDNSMNPQSITPNPSFSVSYRVERGMRIYKTLVQDPKTRSYDPNSHFALSEIINNHALCQGLIGEDAWLTSLKAIMEYSVPYLPRHQVNALWNKIKMNECIANTSPRIQAWLKLFEGLVYRDYSAISIASNSLLNLNEAFADKSLILGYSLLAHIKLGKPEKAWEYWTTYPLSTEPSLQLRLLAAMAYQKNQGANGDQQ